MWLNYDSSDRERIIAVKQTNNLHHWSVGVGKLEEKKLLLIFLVYKYCSIEMTSRTSSNFRTKYNF